MFGFKKESNNFKESVADCNNSIKKCQKDIELKSIAAIEALIKEIRTYDGSMKTEANINLKLESEFKKLESFIAFDPITKQKIFLKGNNNIDIVQELSAFDQALLENAALICAIYEKRASVKTVEELLADKNISGLNYTEKLNHFIDRIKNLKTPEQWYSNDRGVSLSKEHSKNIIKYSTKLLSLIEVMLKLDLLFKVINVKDQLKKYFLLNLKNNNVLKPLDVNSYFTVIVAGKSYDVSCSGKSKLGHNINRVFKNWPKNAGRF
jgi:hypothetical protein